VSEAGREEGMKERCDYHKLTYITYHDLCYIDLLSQIRKKAFQIQLAKCHHSSRLTKK